MARPRNDVSLAPLARHSTRGPLDDADDPPAPHPSSPSTSTATTTDPLTADAANTPIPSTPFSPERGYSIPTSSTLIAAPRPSTPQANEKDLSFLLLPSIYHTLQPPFQLSPDRPTPPAPTTTTSSLPDLLKTHAYHAAATHCAHRLSTPPPPSTADIISLFYTRLTTLVLLGSTSLAAEESRVLEDTGSAFYRSSSGSGSNILSWELRALVARLAALAHKDVKRGVAAFYELGREARAAFVTATKSGKGVEESEMWARRVKECGMGVANVLVEAGDAEGAARHLEGLRRRRQKGEEVGLEVGEMDVRLALTYLSVGDVDAARRCCGGDDSAAHRVLTPLVLIAEGRYDEAAESLRKMQQTDLVKQNLAVCLFYMGQKDESIALLEGLVRKGRGFQALTFNLATCFELSTERASGRKRELAERVVGELRGRGDMGERGAAVFKL